MPETAYKPIETAPKNRTWILLRGRNAAGHLMVPVVAAWMPDGAKHQGWCDSGSFKPVDHLAEDAGADWAPLPT